MSHAALIIEDEVTLARNISQYLVRHGYQAFTASTAEEGLAQMESVRPDIVLIDYHLPGMNGLDWITRLRQEDRKTPVVMMTGHGNVQLAVDAMKAGAQDYLTKPVVLSEILLLVQRLLGAERNQEAFAYFNKRDEAGVASILGESPVIHGLRERVTRLLATEEQILEGDPPSVLITGETGTGKEVVARALHYGGTRRERPFIEVNCAAIPTQLLEAELFGYERGAFTDARERKLGLAEAADGGTLFLDEIGDIEPPMQVKLLKLLEERSVRRLGSLRERRVNVRIIAATNRPLEQMVGEGRFRADLYFRLRVVQLQVPSLRARGDDIILLARHFLAWHGKRYGKPALQFSRGAQNALRQHSWPGNVRELRNAIEQCVLLVTGAEVEERHLMFCEMPALTAGSDTGFTLPEEGVDLEAVERTLVVQALDRCDGNVTQSARLLGLTRDAMRYRIEKFRLKIKGSD